MIRTCPRCKKEKDTSEFLLKNDKPYGNCKSCRVEKYLEKKEYNQNYYIENKDKIRERGKRYVERNAETLKERRREAHIKKKEKWIAAGDGTYEEIKEKQANKDLLRRYGISLECKNRLFELQGSVCAICKSPQNDRKVGLHADHDHTTNEIRGILCLKCNAGLGYFKDNVEILNNAIKYLTKRPSGDGVEILVHNITGDLTLKHNGVSIFEGKEIPDMVWLDLLSDLGCECSFKRISNKDMEEGKY